MPNQVNVSSAPNQVSVQSTETTVTPQILNHTVSVGGSSQIIAVQTQEVSLQIAQNPVAVSVQSATIGVVSGGVQGPVGPQGPAGSDATSDEIIVLNKAERQDTVEDSPSAGDITIYYGIAAPQSSDSAAVWLITRQIYTADGGAFDSAKRFASTAEDQVWNDRLSLSYT